MPSIPTTSNVPICIRSYRSTSVPMSEVTRRPMMPARRSKRSAGSNQRGCLPCGGRRMAATAAHLVERVLPEVPVRQWVLTLPYPLRYRWAWDARLTSEVLRAFLRALFADLRRRARSQYGVGRGYPKDHLLDRLRRDVEHPVAAAGINGLNEFRRTDHHPQIGRGSYRKIGT
jgi:hypothetical protein